MVKRQIFKWTKIRRNSQTVRRMERQKDRPRNRGSENISATMITDRQGRQTDR